MRRHADFNLSSIIGSVFKKGLNQAFQDLQADFVLLATENFDQRIAALSRPERLIRQKPTQRPPLSKPPKKSHAPKMKPNFLKDAVVIDAEIIEG